MTARYTDRYSDEEVADDLAAKPRPEEGHGSPYAEPEGRI